MQDILEKKMFKKVFFIIFLQILGMTNAIKLSTLFHQHRGFTIRKDYHTKTINRATLCKSIISKGRIIWRPPSLDDMVGSLRLGGLHIIMTFSIYYIND